jgi:hypothetical protein
MTETVMTSRNSTILRRGLRATVPVRRYALGVATCLVLAASLLAGCKNSTCTGCTLDVDILNADRITVGKHLYLKGPDGTKFEISVGNDASGKDVVTATPVGK